MEEFIIMAKVACKCSQAAEPVWVTRIGNAYYCKRCHTPVLMEPYGKFTGIIKKNRIQLKPLDPSIVDSNSELIRDLNNRCDELEKKRNKLEVSNMDLGENISQLTKTLHTYRDRINEQDDVIEKVRRKNALLEKDSNEHEEECRVLRNKNSALDTELRNRINICSNLESTMEKQTEIISTLKKEKKELGDACAVLSKDLEKEARENTILRRDMESINESALHYRNLAEAAGKIDLRETMKIILEFMASMENIATERCDPDTIEQMKMRIEYAGMMLQNLGIMISHHERGSELGDERVDVRVRKTNDSEQDCRVSKVNSYGCSFKDDVFTAIPENITVFKYEAPADDDPATERSSEIEEYDPRPSAESAETDAENTESISAEMSSQDDMPSLKTDIEQSDESAHPADTEGDPEACSDSSNAEMSSDNPFSEVIPMSEVDGSVPSDVILLATSNFESSKTSADKPDDVDKI